ncbi:MAG: recombination mediator RecR [Candidatus Nealsonbacteria bacterium]|nr:recombination mediator RecR [Candidatus Nealsonbacteria bacterium]
MYSPTIQKLIDLFSKFPTVGPRTASRFVFYLMRLPKEEIKDFLNSILNLKKTIKICSFCFNPFEPSASLGQKGELCPICQDVTRNRSLICLIEKESDLISIEKTKKYKGLYFILGGLVSVLKKEKIKKLRIKELEERIKAPQKFGILDASFKEIILALNQTTEGQATTLYLKRSLAPFGKKISQLGRGLPVGAELEYADEETLVSALEGRK